MCVSWFAFVLVSEAAIWQHSDLMFLLNLQKVSDDSYCLLRVTLIIVDVDVANSYTEKCNIDRLSIKVSLQL